jgi:hypothetical protein
MKQRRAPVTEPEMNTPAPALLRRALLLLLLAGCTGEPVSPTDVAAPEPSPVAYVDAEPVSLQRFNALYEARSASLSRAGTPPSVSALQLKRRLATELLDELLVEKAAASRGLEVAPDEVDAAEQALRARFPRPAEFDTHVERAGGREELRRGLRSQLLQERLAGIGPGPVLSEAQVRAYYEQHPEQFHVPAHLTALELLLPPGPDGDLRSPRADAARLLAQARAPNANFADLARLHSRGPTARVGGYLGRVTEQAVDPARWKALSALEPGQVSEVVETPEGLHLLKLLERKPAVDVSFEEAWPRIERSYGGALRRARIAETLASLRRELRVTDTFTERYGPLLAAQEPGGGSGDFVGASLASAEARVPASLPVGPAASGASVARDFARPEGR